MSIYNVTLQDQTGEVTEVAYHVRWDSEKIAADEVGKACAIEKRHFSGKVSRDGEASYKKLYQPISCELAIAEPTTT